MLKLSGAFMIFISSLLFGFYKAHELKMRVNCLKSIQAGLDLLYAQISHSGEEIAGILKSCFKDCKSVAVNGSKAKVIKLWLKDGDTAPLKDLFCALGEGKRQDECAKIAICKALCEKNIEDAQRAFDEGAKIRQSLGVCVGLALGIMVI